VPSRIIPLETETYYHVYNRGYNKQTLFFKVNDYLRFERVVAHNLEIYKGIRIKAFCFLPNHFHFLLQEHCLVSSPDSKLKDKHRVRTQKPAQEISAFMRKIQQSYAMYFNYQYADQVKKGLKSPVFEGRFKAKEVLDEAYLSQLVTYIEHNAVKHELVADSKDWPYTSWDFKAPNELQTDFFSDFI